MGSTSGHDAGFALPHPRPDVVLRRGALDLLAGSTGRVAVVAAPAGYGKTSHVAAWAARDGRPAAWVGLDPADDDPDALLALLVASLAAVTDLRPDVAGFVAASLGRAVRRCTVPFVLVLDDAHHLRDPRSIDLVDAVVHNVPPGSTVVLSGRAAPGASLARLRVHDAMVEVTADDLALDTTDARTLLDALGVGMADDEVARLVADTEGWPVGIRLAGLAAGRAGAADDGARWIDDRAVADYLLEEWLRGLPATDVDFLTRVSVLDRLSGPECDAVLGRSDSGCVLDRLHAARLVLVPLDRQGDAYRMHRLLRDVLAARFERADRAARRDADARASEWFEGAGDIDRSIRHAVRAGDLGRAEQLVATHAADYHTSGRHRSVVAWLGELPRAHTIASPSLCVAAALASLGTGDQIATTTWLRFAEEALAATSPGPADPAVDLQVVTLRALVTTADVRRTLAEVSHAERALPPGHWHAAACLGHGTLSFLVGDDEVAIELLTRGAVEAHLVGAVTPEVLCRAHLAVALDLAGDGPGAAAAIRAARELMRRHGLDDMPTLVLATATSALVEGTEGSPDVARAEAALTQRNLASLQPGTGWIDVQARLVLARALMLLGERAAAHAVLDTIAPHVRAVPDATRAVEQLDALLGQLRAARTALPCGPSSLTAAELRVLHYLPTNLTHEEIARRLFVSRNTTKSHAASVYRKLGATSRSQAVEIARAAGLLPAGEPALAGP